MKIPVWRDVDVVVVGAATGAVAAALELRRRGCGVLVLSDLSYFGEETAGTLNLWPSGLGRSDPLLRTIFPQDDRRPVPPLRVKRALESALVEADIPFLYLTRPVSLLKDQNGMLGGVVLAARTSLFAVRCRAVVDASRHGFAARLAEIPLSLRPDLPDSLSWIVISKGQPEGWSGQLEELPYPFMRHVEGQETAFTAYKLTTARGGLGDDLRVLEHRLRSTLAAANVQAAAEVVPVVSPEFVTWRDGVLARRLADLPDAVFSAAPGIFLASGLLPLSTAGALDLERADAQISMGRRVGALAAAAVSDVKCRQAASLSSCSGCGAHGAFHFADAFLREKSGEIEIDPLAFPSLGSVDVLVAGGGTGGAPAGIAAARDGARTVVLEVQHQLGGIGSVGLISSYWYGNRVGFTAELDAKTKCLDPKLYDAFQGRIWRPELRSGIYHRLLLEAGGTAWMRSFSFGVRMDGSRVDGVLVSTPFGCGLLETGCVVDATGNADIAAAAGAPCRVISSEHLATQGTGLAPRLHPDRGANTDWTFVDETDPEGITAAFAAARVKFSDAFDNSPMIDSRERRQILGEYEVTPLDILSHRTFPDTVVTAASNFDTHGFIVHPVFMTSAPSDDYKTLQAHVPLRCMLPRGVESVIVTGLGMSAHRDALPVLRMQADVQNQGFAAGLAAAVCAKDGGRLRELDVKAFQHRLVKLGVISKEVVMHEDSFPLSDTAIEEAVGGNLRSSLNAAILFANPERCRARLRQRLNDASNPDGQEDAALILGLMGFPEAAPLLAGRLKSQSWDEGWNYKGMHQNGPSMSRMDALVIALARTCDAAAVEVVAAKIQELDADPAFSHCRMVATAAALMRNGHLARGLAELLRRPGMGGHACTRLSEMLTGVDPDPIENTTRNLSLRELYLARGLFLAGDVAGLGEEILKRYERDLRGHYARFAKAVLEQSRTTDKTIPQLAMS